jgi:antitoxin MazE
VSSKGSRVELVVSRWGNSLAVRLPATSVRRMGVGEGDKLLAEVSADGRLILVPEGRRTLDPAAVAQLRRSLARQKQTRPVVGPMRRRARY